jgi:hypothetical protein
MMTAKGYAITFNREIKEKEENVRLIDMNQYI